MKIAGVVILYFPDINVIDNIKSYYNEVDILYLINNGSDSDAIKKVRKLKGKKIIYVQLDENRGIAYAQRFAAELAERNGCDWLLTMDQDSRFEGNSLQEMILYIKNKNTDNIGILAPSYAMPHQKFQPHKRETSDIK